jgi:hypothetical protein
MEQITTVGVSIVSDGPTELDRELLQLIAGGLPKGGWASESQSTMADSVSLLPKGGWEA